MKLSALMLALLCTASLPALAQSHSDTRRNRDGSMDIRHSDGSSTRITRDLSKRVIAEHSNGSRSVTTTDLSGRKRTTYSDGSYSDTTTDLSGRWRTEYSDGSYSTSVQDLSGNWRTTASGGMAARHPERGFGKKR
ncbi:TPA: hypothetical protein ACKP39_000211 [Stenotrophomonas maltophilia]